jgi:signal transduction histidine kinase
MRQRLLIAILVLVALTLVIMSVGSLLLIRRDSANTAEQQLYSQTRAIANYPSIEQVVSKELLAVKVVGQYDSLSIVGLSADGAFSERLPKVVDGVALIGDKLVADHAVAGSRDGQVYVLIPLALSTTQKATLTPPLPYQDTAVLVATRTLTPTVNGLWYFVIIGLGALVVAAVVAYWLANRFSAPLVRAVATTQRIAAGDLSLDGVNAPSEMPEFAALHAAMESMAENLARAQHQQRQFLLSVSHDLRTPLTSILGYTDAITEGITTDVEGAVSVIATEARRLERLVQDLLDLARLDARRFSLASDPLDTVEVVHATLERHQPEAALQALELEAVVPAASIPLLGDRDRLIQLLSNLVENAMRYAQHRIEVGTEANGKVVRLWVSDDGVGISASDQARVFQPDFSTDRSGQRRFGTGLGLAIVSELAVSMGGSVQVHSPVQSFGGTSFVVSLPLS